jgi:hypothetical protein
VKLRILLLFCAVQFLGCILIFLPGAVAENSQSPFVVFTWFAGLVLLLPGYALAFFLGGFPATFVFNAVFWVAGSIIFLRRRRLKGQGT